LKTLGIIPARGGSKGILKKNIKLLKNKPLIAYTIEAALSSNIDQVIVSTDCEEIAEISRIYGAEVMMRPENLADDNSATLPVLQNVIERLNMNFDAILTLQPTSPLRTTADINNSLKIFNEDKDADSLVSVVEVPHNYSSEKIMNYDGRYLTGNNKIKRRQEVLPTYARNGAAIYITKIDKLNNYIFGGKIIPYFMTKFNSFDIDDMEDWKIVEKLID